jgi:hypothetical protein
LWAPPRAQTDKLQGNALTELYQIACNLMLRWSSERMVAMTVDLPRTKVQREPRRQLQGRPAWLTVDNEVTKSECLVMDVSPGGARIVTDAAIDVSDRFRLALVPEHPKRQPCEVVWRRGKMFGVKFVR